MTIDEAIQSLQAEKEKGVKSIFMAYWKAENFDRQDDEKWAKCTKRLASEINELGLAGMPPRWITQAFQVVEKFLYPKTETK